MHTAAHSVGDTLRTAIKLSFIAFLIEAIGGLYADSLALLSDASHVFSDLLALMITFFALWLASRPVTAKYTFGYHRAEVFGALINALLLLIMAVSIGTEALKRLGTPPETRGMAVIVIGALGVIPNLWTVARLKKSANINIQSAFLHALGDMLASVAVVLGGALILITGQTIFDPIASLVVVAILLVGAMRLLRQVFSILIEGTPPNIDREKISKLICSAQGVRSAHDLHLWTLCSDVVYFAGHLVIEPQVDFPHAKDIANRVARTLNDCGIHHTTLQVEMPDISCSKEEKCEIIH